jgi:hypothetical protein
MYTKLLRTCSLYCAKSYCFMVNFLYPKLIPSYVSAFSWQRTPTKVKYLLVCVDFCPLRFDATHCKLGVPAKQCVVHPENGKKIYLQRWNLCARLHGVTST